VDVADFEKLLPPILLGFGGVIPLLIAKPPFSVRDGLKPLMAVIFVLVVWASYLASYMLFARRFYDYRITLWSLFFAVGMFFGIYFLVRPDSDEAKKPGAWMFLIYSAAICILAASAANYIGPKDYVVLDLSVTDPNEKTKLLPIIDVTYTSNHHNYSLIFKTTDGHSLTLMQKSLFEKLPLVTVQITPSQSAGKTLKDLYDFDKERLQKTLEPGLTEKFSGTIKAENAPE
jgi:hypothetical protein